MGAISNVINGAANLFKGGDLSKIAGNILQTLTGVKVGGQSDEYNNQSQASAQRLATSPFEKNGLFSDSGESN